MGQELRRKVEAPGSASEDDSDADSATDASDEEADAAQDLSKPSKKAVAKAKAAAMDIMQSEFLVLLLMPVDKLARIAPLENKSAELEPLVLRGVGCQLICLTIRQYIGSHREMYGSHLWE